VRLSVCVSTLPLKVRSAPSIPGLKVKTNFMLEQATKAQRGNRGIAVLLSYPLCKLVGGQTRAGVTF
jgi:hypothetical protein